jgi:3-hydroxybutyrate dehydrogenase
MGRIGVPFHAAYGITKYGSETFSDILRLEMRKFGVKVIVVEPGNFAGITEF